MRCDCEQCESNDAGYCLIGNYVRIDENGVCTDMVPRREEESDNAT